MQFRGDLNIRNNTIRFVIAYSESKIFAENTESRKKSIYNGTIVSGTLP